MISNLITLLFVLYIAHTVVSIIFLYLDKDYYKAIYGNQKFHKAVTYLPLWPILPLIKWFKNKRKKY